MEAMHRESEKIVRSQHVGIVKTSRPPRTIMEIQQSFKLKER